MAEKRWADELAGVIHNSLVECSARIGEPLAMLSVDCHPWNGVLALALLTQAEILRDPLLATPAEMAAWEHYDIGSTLASWAPASSLGSEMRDEYDGSKHSRADVAKAYFQLCAAATASDKVREALARYQLSDIFRISVCHPDTGEEYA